MGDRLQKTTPFQEGQNTNDHKGDAPKVRVLANSSKSRFSPGHDPLMQSLSAGIPDIPTKQHPFDKAKFHPKGVSYNPAGEYGRIKGKATPPTRYSSHTSRPGGNPLGSHSNRTGQKSGYPNFTPRGGGRQP